MSDKISKGDAVCLLRDMSTKIERGELEFVAGAENRCANSEYSITVTVITSERLRLEYEDFVIKFRALDPFACPPEGDPRIEEYFVWIQAQPCGARRCMEIKLHDARRTNERMRL